MIPRQPVDQKRAVHVVTFYLCIAVTFLNRLGDGWGKETQGSTTRLTTQSRGDPSFGLLVPYAEDYRRWTAVSVPKAEINWIVVPKSR